MTTTNLDDYYTYIDLRDPEVLQLIRAHVADAEANNLFYLTWTGQLRTDFPDNIVYRLKQLMPFPVSDFGVFKNPPGWRYPIHKDAQRWAAMNLVLTAPSANSGANIYDEDQQLIGPIPYLLDQWVLINTCRFHDVVNTSDATRYVVTIGSSERSYDHIKTKFERLGMLGVTSWRDERHLALLSNWEKAALQDVMLALPQNPVVVEVGSFMGGSCAVMARVRPDAEIHGFDLFELDTVNTTVKGYRRDVFDRLVGQRQAARTRANVQAVLADYPNVRLHCCRSPQGIEWDRPVDLYFEDGCHKDPELSANIEFWEPRVRPGGWVVLHDYRPHAAADWRWRFPDVERWVDRLRSQGYDLVAHIHGLAILRKPED